MRNTSIFFRIFISDPFTFIVFQVMLTLLCMVTRHFRINTLTCIRLVLQKQFNVWHFGARQLLSFYLMKQFLMSFAFVDVSSIFDSLADSLMHPARINQERHVVQAEEIYSEVWYKCSSSPRRLRRPRAARFIKSGTCKQISRAIKKIFIFPPKNLQKIRVHCCFLLILWVKSLQICWIFPPKDLGKIRRPKYACANFLKIW